MPSRAKVAAAAALLGVAVAVGRPSTISSSAGLEYLDDVALSRKLHLGDYKPLVAEVLRGNPELAATLRAHVLSAKGQYHQRSAVDKKMHAEKMGLRVALHISELNQQASQKNKTPLLMARSISDLLVEQETKSHAASTSFQG